MKKSIIIMLVFVMALSLAACGGGIETTNTPPPMTNAEQTLEPAAETEKNPSIELTIDNYNKYINYTRYCRLDTDSKYFVTKTHKGSDGNTIGTLYKQGIFHVEVTGASSNYNYEDVIIVVKVTGYAECYSGNNPLKSEGNIDFEKECVVECNIAGNGKNQVSISFNPAAYLLHNIEFEVVSVSGTLTPA